MDKPKFAVQLAELRNSKGFTQQQVADATGLSRARLNNYEQGIREPDLDTLIKLAQFYNTSVDSLLGVAPPNHPETPDSSLPALTAKDEAEIARDLEAMLGSMDDRNGMAAYNDPEDDEDRELLKASLETSMRLAKQMAKKKYTPKKYRKE